MRKSGVIGLLAIVTLASPALAVDIDQGIYVGASAARASVDASRDGLEFSGDATGGKVFGGLRLMRFLGIEAGRVDFGDSDDEIGGESVEVALDGFDAFAMGLLPLGKRFELFAKTGYIKWDVNSNSDHASFDFDDDGTDPAYGFGAAFRIISSLQVRLEYERFEIGATDDTDLISVGATYTF